MKKNLCLTITAALLLSINAAAFAGDFICSPNSQTSSCKVATLVPPMMGAEAYLQEQAYPANSLISSSRDSVLLMNTGWKAYHDTEASTTPSPSR